MAQVPKKIDFHSFTLNIESPKISVNEILPPSKSPHKEILLISYLTRTKTFSIFSLLSQLKSEMDAKFVSKANFNVNKKYPANCHITFNTYILLVERVLL